MDSEKKLFRETRVYPVVFMFIITFIFIGILATFYQVTSEQVEAYRQTQLKKSILAVFELPYQDIEADFAEYVTEKETSELKFYEAVVDSVVQGYCVPITGSGLWGTIYALLAVTPDLSTVINMEIITQNETPGLGGRITENWFKQQFKDKLLYDNGELANYVLIPEDETAGKFQIRQVTGATASSKAVVDMIYKNVKQFTPKLRAEL